MKVKKLILILNLKDVGYKEINVQRKNWALTSSQILEVSANQSVAFSSFECEFLTSYKKIF